MEMKLSIWEMTNYVVRIVDRRTHDLGIAIHVVIELLRAGGEG